MSQVTSDESIRSTAIEWLVRLESPQLTQAEEEAFFNWLNQKPEHQQAYIEAEQFWENLASLETANEATDEVEKPVNPEAVPRDASRPRDKAPPQPQTSPRNPWIKPWYRPAVAASLAALVALLVVQLWPSVDHMQFHTLRGQQRQITLADGSVIHLNTNSTLGVSLQKNNRLARLQQGEAFFNISPDPDRPFIVRTATGVVRVLGTSFNVRANEEETIVTVLEGKVGVSREVSKELTGEETDLANYQPAITLTADQRVTLKAATPISPETADAQVTTSWRSGKQVYKGVRFAKVVEDLNRYFPGEIKLGDPALYDVEVVAVLNLHNKASAIAALESTFDVVAVEESARLTVLYPSLALNQKPASNQ